MQSTMYTYTPHTSRLVWHAVLHACLIVAAQGLVPIRQGVWQVLYFAYLTEYTVHHSQLCYYPEALSLYACRSRQQKQEEGQNRPWTP